MKQAFISVNGWDTRYAHAGERGPALILLHGLGATLESWWCSIDPLGANFRVYAPDILYFGKSAKPDHTPTQADFVEFTNGFMHALGLEHAVLVGNSMGGMIAAKTAILYPDRVDALILVNSAGFGPEVAWWLRLRSMVDLRPRGTPAPWMVRLGLRAIFQDPNRVPDEVLNVLVEASANPEHQVATRRVLGVGVNWRGLKPGVLAEIRDTADQIRVPTLIIWGKQDRVVPVKQAKVAHEKIPQARLHVFEDCGHAPQLEYPDDFNTLVRDFVREKVPA
jgi:4,5:9,10-diseco-3-hydroxy-5,9,17-trioxoandrosta-1(10),2-diene-4-oate hydrolase